MSEDTDFKMSLPEQREEKDTESKCDESMKNLPSTFSDGNTTSDPSMIKRDRSESPQPSCWSLKSDSSMKTPPKLSDGRVTSDPSMIKKDRSESPQPSCWSLKSDSSMKTPPKLSDGRVTSDPSRRKRQRSESPEPSGVSVKTSRKPNPVFRDGLLSSNPFLAGCNLTAQDCEILASPLQSSNCVLRELDLSNNDLQDSGVKHLSHGLKSPKCQLDILRLSGCMVTEEGCGYVSSALRSNPSHLRELDLSYNHPGQSGVQLLNDKLKDPNYKLEILNLEHGNPFRITPGLRKYACDLTLDPNTAHTQLILSEENRKATRVEEKQPYPDHPERFENNEQVLCQESLTGRCYWEAEWSGFKADVAVAYKGISRKGVSDCWFGNSDISWSLFCTGNGFHVWHVNKSTYVPAPSPPSNRVGVYVDMSAGTLSFYSVSDTHTLTHLHTFNTTFTEPLYAGFKAYDASVSLCQIKQPAKRYN